MDNQPENKPPRKRPIVVAFALAALGLLLIGGGADSLALRNGGVLA